MIMEGQTQKWKSLKTVSELLEIDYSNRHRKLRAFIKRLIKHRGFPFHIFVP